MAGKQAQMESPLWRGLKFALIGLIGGVLAGLAFAFPIWLIGGASLGASHVLRALVIGFPLGGFVGGFLVGFVFREGIGGLVERSFQGPRGRTRSEHSALQTLIIQGDYRQALEACARQAEASPGDPEPLILGAGVLRDHMKQYQTAAQWLRRAQRVKALTRDQDITIARELVELYERKLETPRKALPELARIAEMYPGTRAAEWAENTLKQIRAELWTDVKGGPDEEGG